MHLALGVTPGPCVIGLTFRRDVMWSWLLVMSYAGLIFYLSSQSDISGPLFLDFPGFDKIVHAVEYGLLALLLYWAISCSFPTLSVRSIGVVAVVGSVLYGISDEIHQAFVPLRHSDPVDVLADGLGSTLAVIAYGMIAGTHNAFRSASSRYGRRTRR